MSLSAAKIGMYSLQPVVENGNWSVKERWYQPKAALDMSSAVIVDGRCTA